VAGIVDPGHSSYKQKRSLRQALSAQADPLSSPLREPENLLPQEINSRKTLTPLLHRGVQKLGGF
jgi:hypothetical protein